VKKEAKNGLLQTSRVVDEERGCTLIINLRSFFMLVYLLNDRSPVRLAEGARTKY
jgi:hypothetical protein